MELKLVTVGKTDVKWVKEGLDLYVSRLRHYVPFSLVEIPQLKNVSALSQEQIKEKEGELILKQLNPGDSVILLDERGKEYRSVEWVCWTSAARSTVPSNGRNGSGSGSPGAGRAWSSSSAGPMVSPRRSMTGLRE